MHKPKRGSFYVVDIIQVLIQQSDFQAARKYWNKLKERLGKEGNQSVSNCHRLKLLVADGNSCLTDIVRAETLLRYTKFSIAADSLTSLGNFGMLCSRNIKQ